MFTNLSSHTDAFALLCWWAFSHLLVFVLAFPLHEVPVLSDSAHPLRVITECGLLCSPLLELIIVSVWKAFLKIVPLSHWTGSFLRM